MLFFTMFYLMVSTGVGYSAHYCGEELFELGYIASDISCCCGDEELDDCCHNETYFVQLDEDQQVTSNDIRINQENLAQPLPLWLFNEEGSFMKSELVATDFHSLSPHPKITPLFLTFQSLIFYG